jgi:hypothetical protein
MDVQSFSVIYEKQACTRSIAPIQAPLLAQWTLTAPGKIAILWKASLHKI